MNKTRWNIKINLQLKKSFFSTNHELSLLKFFLVNSIPYMAIKRSTKVHKSQKTLRTGCTENRHSHISDKIKDHWCPTNPHHRQPSLGISTTRPRSFIAYQPTLNPVLEANKVASQKQLTPTHLLTFIWWKIACVSSNMPSFI